MLVFRQFSFFYVNEKWDKKSLCTCKEIIGIILASSWNLQRLDFLINKLWGELENGLYQVIEGGE